MCMASINTVQSKYKKKEIQIGGLDGDPPTSNAYISSHRLYSNVIPTAIPMFSGSANTMGQVSKRKTGNGKSKMTAITPEMRISQFADKKATC